MDTREKLQKIEDLPNLVDREQWMIVAGEFDPVTAAVADRLAKLKTTGCKLLVIVKSGAENTLLNPQSRAVLLAALRLVDMVMIETGSDWRAVVRRNVVEIVEDAEFDTRLRIAFESLVAGRRQAFKS